MGCAWSWWLSLPMGPGPALIGSMGEKSLDVDPLIPVVDDGQQPVMIAFDIKDGIGINKIGGRPDRPHGHEITKILALHEFPPTAQGLSGIGILRRIGI